jgi:hypothetical protein
MAEWWDWTGEPGPWQSNEAPALDWGDFTRGGPGSWYGQETTDWANGPSDDGRGGGIPPWLSSILGAVGPALKQFGGPAATTIGSLLNAGNASGAAQQAGQQESSALNRGIDLQTAQWLQQQQNLAPYMQAGTQGLQGLQDLLQRDQPGLPGATPAIGKPDYFPGSTPGWTPQNYQAQVPVPDPNGYMWRPGQGPSAQDYRYTPGQTPDAAQYASGPPQLYQGAMPGTQVSQLTGQQVLDQDPGAAFRQSEARKALEGSAAARGDLLSGGTLQALQARSQDLASQEYGNAWQRMMARDTEQYGRNWGQYQQAWNQGVQGTQLGLATNAQNFGQALSAAQLREQVNQVASQQGWSQAQAEAAFREGMAQQSSQQGYAQALAGQQANFGQQLQAQQWNVGQQQRYDQDQYSRMLEQAKLRYGIDVSQNMTDYERQQNLYRQQLSQHLLPWEQQSTLANLGGQAVSAYGTQGQRATSGISELLARLGQTQGQSTLGSALAQNTGTTTIANSLASVLSRLNS